MSFYILHIDFKFINNSSGTYFVFLYKLVTLTILRMPTKILDFLLNVYLTRAIQFNINSDEFRIQYDAVA